MKKNESAIIPSPDVLEAPDIPDVPENPVVNGIVNIADIPDMPDMSDMPGAASIPRDSHVFVTSGMPNTVNLPDSPDTLDTLDTLDTPGASAVSVCPDLSDPSDLPTTSVSSGIEGHGSGAQDVAVQSSLPAVRGLVLAGGLSSRLGHDKVSLKIHSDFGITDLLERSMGLLRAVVDEVVIVGRHVGDYPSIPDLVARKGPVGGIASALAAFPDEAVLVLSCDLPFMNVSTLRRLLQARAKAPAGTLMTAYRQAETGHKEALVAIYEPGAAPYFLDCLHGDKLKVSKVVPEGQQYFIEYGADGSLPFFNINYPADLEVVKRLIEIVHAVEE